MRHIYVVVFLMLISFHFVFSQKFDKVDTSSWYKVSLPIDNVKKAAILNNQSYGWHKPAGKYGRVLSEEGDFVLEKNGKAVKFWGIGIGGSGVYPFKSDAEYMAKRLAKYGFNMVRFHSLDGILMEDPKQNAAKSGKLSKNRLDRMAYFIAELKKQGIYVCFNFWYTPKLGKNDGIEDADKIQNLCNEYLFFDSKAQKVYLRFIEQILTYKNPYTKMTFGDDPTVAFACVVNECDMFYSTLGNLPPAQKVKLLNGWNNWLKKKYKSQYNLMKKWKVKGKKRPFNSGEQLSKKNLTVFSVGEMTNPKPYMFKRAAAQAEYYRTIQDKWYMTVKRFIDKKLNSGILLAGSNWASKKWLKAVNDSQQAKLDYIDKHSYWDHPHGGWSAMQCNFSNKSMLSNPFVNLMNCGYSQVSYRPFMVSEWACVSPNEYQCEEGPLVGAYSALQGWDAMVVFCTKTADWTGRMASNLFEVFDNPSRALLHSIAAMLFVRGDIKEAPYVYRPVLADDEKLFNPERWHSDDKESEDTGSMMFVSWAEGPVRGAWKAIGRIGVSFRKKDKEIHADKSEIKKYWNPKTKIIKSMTKQLLWNYGKERLLVNTPKTKGILGKLQGKKHRLGKTDISGKTGFGGVFITSLDNKAIEESLHIAVFAAGRARNTNMQYMKSGGRWRLANLGNMPIITEPVKVNISFSNCNKGWKCRKLNVNYHPKGDISSAVKENGGNVEISLNTAENKTAVYELYLK